MNIVTASFITTVRKWPKCLSDKKQHCNTSVISITNTWMQQQFQVFWLKNKQVLGH